MTEIQNFKVDKENISDDGLSSAIHSLKLKLTADRTPLVEATQDIEEATNNPEIKRWLKNHGYTNFAGDTSSSESIETPKGEDVSNDPNIKQWLVNHGYGNLIESPSVDEQTYGFPLPRYGTDDTKIEELFVRPGQKQMLQKAWKDMSREADLMNQLERQPRLPGVWDDITRYVREHEHDSRHLADSSSIRSAWDKMLHSAYRQPPPGYSHPTASPPIPPNKFSAVARSSISDFQPAGQNVRFSGSEFLPENTEIYRKKDENPNDVVYKQRVYVRYLQPPTPPPGGPIIIKETQDPPPPTPPAIIIRQEAGPPPPTPPPIIYREQPPPMPQQQPTTIIEKHVPAPPPPRQIIIEKMPPLPPKQPDIIIEKWLPPKLNQQRQVIYQKCPPVCPQPPQTIVIQQSPPNVNVVREVFAQPQPAIPCIPTTYCYPPTQLCVPAGSILNTLVTSPQNLCTPPGFVCNFPGNTSVENVLKQLGINTNSLQFLGSSGYPQPNIHPQSPVYPHTQPVHHASPIFTPENLQRIGSHVPINVRQNISDEWKLLQDTMQQSQQPKRLSFTEFAKIGEPYVPPMRESVQSAWDAILRSTNTTQQPAPQQNQLGLSDFSQIGAKYVPPLSQSLQNVWSNITEAASTQNPPQMSQQKFEQIGAKFVPPTEQSVQNVWSNILGAVDKQPRQTAQTVYPIAAATTASKLFSELYGGGNVLSGLENKINIASKQMPFTSLLESYARKQFQMMNLSSVY